MNKFKTAAIEILQKVKVPLHYKDITQRALEEGILETDGATPEASLNAQLSVDIKNKGEASDFIRVSPGIFNLNPDRKEPEKKDSMQSMVKNCNLNKKARFPGPVSSGRTELKTPYGYVLNYCLPSYVFI